MNERRLSLNQITINRADIQQLAELCAAHDIGWVSLWRDKVAEMGLSESARIIRDYGLKVSSLCRGGMFPASSEAGRMARLDDNRRAIDEAATLGAEVLVLVCGGLPDKDLDFARATVERALETLLPYADSHNVKLGIEPLHPVFAADRSVINTLAQANDMAERLSHQVGVVVDVYHVWWDPSLYREISRANGNIVGFHVNDWVVPIVDPLLCRGIMGDGYIEISRIRHAIEQSGYSGPIEVEILNQKVWDTPYTELLPLIKKRFGSCV